MSFNDVQRLFHAYTHTHTVRCWGSQLACTVAAPACVEMNALPRASHSSEIALPGSRRPRSTLAVASALFAHAAVSEQRFTIFFTNSIKVPSINQSNNPSINQCLDAHLTLAQQINAHQRDYFLAHTLMHLTQCAVLSSKMIS